MEEYRDMFLIGGFIKDIKGIAGTTVLGDVTVTLILDVAAIFDERRKDHG